MTECNAEELRTKLDLHLSMLWGARSKAEKDAADELLVTTNYFCECDECKAKEVMRALEGGGRSDIKTKFDQRRWVSTYVHSRLVFNKDKRSAMEEAFGID